MRGSRWKGLGRRGLCRGERCVIRTAVEKEGSGVCLVRWMLIVVYSIYTLARVLEDTDTLLLATIQLTPVWRRAEPSELLITPRFHNRDSTRMLYHPAVHTRSSSCVSSFVALPSFT